MNTNRTDDNRLAGRSGWAGLAGPILTYGFATAVGVWTAWYITHLPWADLSERTTIPVLLVTWLIGTIAAGQAAGVMAGIGSGLTAAILGLLILGSKIVEPAATGSGAGDLKPNAGLIVIGFLVLGAAIGTVGGFLGAMFSGGRRKRGVDWLARFGVVAAVAVAPLLFIGGMVTSTNSGMAVPDWPNTFGSNMFLYPLGPRAAPNVFMEHAHRLFGALVGVTTLALAGYVLVAETRRWVKIVALVAFALVCVQGVLGGARVRMDERVLAMLHGVLAQLTFGTLVALAVYLSPTFKRAPESIQPGSGEPQLRRLKFFSTGLLHSTILQLLFGAAYRHFRDSHSLWTHAGFSVVVLIFALMAGFIATAIAGEYGGIGPTLRRCGRLLVVVVILQFLLGWATFSLGGRGIQADTAGQAVLRTVHQANGGLLLAAATLTFLWARRLFRLAAPAARVAPITAR